jgi:hypothetical protein
MLYFVGGVILAVAGIAALWQLKLAKESLKTAQDNLQIATNALTASKEDMSIRIERESVVLAASQCEKFGNELLTLAASATEALMAAHVHGIEWELNNDLFDESSLKESTHANKWLRELRDKHFIHTVVDVLNHFEGFSMYFAKGAADEKIAYPVCAVVFCSYVREFAPVLISLRKGKIDRASGSFQNTVELYKTWAGRLEREKLEQERGLLQDKLSAIHITDIDVIGTKRKS